MDEVAQKREENERRIREDQAKRDKEDAQREKEREAKRDKAEAEYIKAMNAKSDDGTDDDYGDDDGFDGDDTVPGSDTVAGGDDSIAGGDDTVASAERQRKQQADALDRVLGTGDNDVRRMQGGSHPAADGTDGKPAELRPGQSGYLGSQPGQRDGGDGVIRDENNNVISPAVGGEAGNAATAAPDGRTSPPAQNVTPPVGGPEKSGADAISSAAGFNAIGGGDPDNGNPEPAPNKEVPPQTKPVGKVGDKPKGKHK